MTGESGDPFKQTFRASLKSILQHSDIIELHSKLDKTNKESYVEAINWWFASRGVKERATTIKEAEVGLNGLLQGFLGLNQKTEAALLLWGNVLFDPRPRSVQMIWKDLEEFNKLLIIGPGAIGKSFTIACWTVLDWIEWPNGTSTKLISTTAGHARANTFSTLSMFHRESAIPLPGIVKDGFIGLGTTDKRSSIAVVAIPPGDDGKGRLQGFHPIPVAKRHSKFGNKTRVRAIMDEGESIPSGIWQGVDNMLITMDSTGSTKVSGVTNPRLKESSFGQRVEPLMGWESIDRETSERWVSKQGWNVLRLDGKKGENVIEKKVIYPGMITYEGYMSYVSKGAHHPETDTMARGWYPEGGTLFHVTPDYFFNDSVGIYTFVGMPNAIASFDPAFAPGGDNPVMTVGRYGQVTGFTPFGREYIQFPRTIYGLQLEQQFMIKKDLTPHVSVEIQNYLKALQVRPEWFVIDKTGNGLGLHDDLKVRFGDIMGIMWSEAATERKILEEDTATAEERFDGVVSEMAFAFSIWLQFGYIKFAPMMNITKLRAQATGRQYTYRGKGLQRVQSKQDFKDLTGGQSPDEYDSVIMLPHLIRIRRSQNAAMLPGVISARPADYKEAKSVVDKVTFFDTK